MQRQPVRCLKDTCDMFPFELPWHLWHLLWWTGLAAPPLRRHVSGSYGYGQCHDESHGDAASCGEMICSKTPLSWSIDDVIWSQWWGFFCDVVWSLFWNCDSSHDDFVARICWVYTTPHQSKMYNWPDAPDQTIKLYTLDILTLFNHETLHTKNTTHQTTSIS